MNEEVNEILELVDESMKKSLEAFQRDLSRIRTGRANLSILDGVRVEYYGTMTPLNQVAALTVADARLITVKPWDKTSISTIEKALLVADIGLNPSSDGEIIRLPIPPLTGERRKGLVRQVGKTAEDAKVAIRNCRRDGNDMLKDVDALPEDDEKRGRKFIQDKTDAFVKKIDELGALKEKEILEV